MAVEKPDGPVHIGLVIPGRDQVDTGSGTATDLMQKARTRTIRKYTVFAGSQPEHPLQDLDGLAHRPTVGIRTKEPALTAGGTTVIRDARVFMPAEHQVGIGFVIPEQNVVARLESLDQVVLKQQDRKSVV